MVKFTPDAAASISVGKQSRTPKHIEKKKLWPEMLSCRASSQISDFRRASKRIIMPLARDIELGKPTSAI